MSWNAFTACRGAAGVHGRRLYLRDRRAEGPQVAIGDTGCDCRTMRVAMVACGLVACVGGGGGGDGLRLDQFAGRLAEAQCAQMQRCCESEWPDCVAFFTMALEEEADIVDMRASIAAGRLTFDGDQAARCIERVEGLSCAEFSAFLQNEQAATGLACFELTPAMTAHTAAIAERFQPRRLGATQRCGVSAARVKTTTRWQMNVSS